MRFFIIVILIGIASSSHAQWVHLDVPGLPGVEFLNFVAESESSVFLGTRDRGLLRTTDRGVDWAMADADASSLNVLCFVGTPFCWVFGTSDSGLFVSTDSGAHWHTPIIPPRDSDIVALCLYGYEPFAASSTEIYPSTGDGDYWGKSRTSPGIQGPAPGIKAIVFCHSILFVLCSGTSGIDTLYRTTNYGNSWSPVGTGILGNPFTTIVSGSYILAGTNDGIFRSANDGTDWTKTSTQSSVLALASLGDTIVAGSANGDLYFSVDYGSSWTLDGSSRSTFQGSPIRSLVLNNQDVYAITGSGIWRRSRAELVAQSSVSKRKLQGTSLESYPNPFSRSTLISFTHESNGYADISIVNQLGVEVARVFSGELEAGKHTFTWSSTSSLPDAAYDCVVRVNGQTNTLPILLVR